jgi:hypothetical protein
MCVVDVCRRHQVGLLAATSLSSGVCGIRWCVPTSYGSKVGGGPDTVSADERAAPVASSVTRCPHHVRNRHARRRAASVGDAERLLRVEVADFDRQPVPRLAAAQPVAADAEPTFNGPTAASANHVAR